MSKEMTKMKNVEPLEDYRLQSIFQRRLRKQPEKIRNALKAMGKCCRKMIPTNTYYVNVLGTRRLDKSIDNGHEFDRTGFHGTAKCNNLWACPVCSARLLTVKAKALTAFLESISETHAAFMITYTIPHTLHQSADLIVKRFKQVRRQAMHGKAEKLLKQMGRFGTVTTNEVTYTPYGWHYHQHILYIVQKENWQMAETFYAEVKQRWDNALIMTLVDYIPEEYDDEAVWLSRNSSGEVLQVMDGRYLFGYGIELTKSERHHPTHRSRSLFDLIDSPHEEDFDTLCEWLLATRKLHRITLSRGMGPLISRFEEEKKMEQSADIETVVVGSFTSSGWDDLLEAEIVTGLDLRYGVLKSALDGYESVVKFLARHNLSIPFLPPQQILSKVRHRTENDDAPDNSVRKFNVIQAAKDMCNNEDVLRLHAGYEEFKKRYAG